MGRTSAKINRLEGRTAKVEQEIIKLKRDKEEMREQVNLLTDGRIIEMLQETNSPYSNKPRYTYDEISAAANRSKGYISNLAQKNGLGRRNIRPV